MRILTTWKTCRPMFIAVVVVATAIVVLLLTVRNRPESIRQEPTFLLNDEGFITDCITKTVIGRVPDNILTTPLELQEEEKSDENWEQRKASFEKVFINRYWGDKHDINYKGIAASGYASTLRYTQEAVAGLHSIINDFKRKNGVSRVRILDIPCGDMAWMSRFLKTRDDIDYTGMDIVPDLIANHLKTFTKFPWKFLNQDIVEKPLNQSFDIILCRMMLQHLHTRDVIMVLKRFSDSGSHLLLASTFYTYSFNKNLPNATDRFRHLNLEIPPVFLIPPLCIFRDGEVDDSHGRANFLALWNLPLKRIEQCHDATAFTLIGRNIKIYSCTDWSLSV